MKIGSLSEMGAREIFKSINQLLKKFNIHAIVQLLADDHKLSLFNITVA